jgi:SAM-dependent methyltransferase
MTIEYNHSSNLHTLGGAAAALSTILHSKIPASVLDVGCGTGTWMRAAIDLGVKTVRGVDGILVPDCKLLIDKALVEQHDLTKPFDFGAKFELVLCLEVGEHLPQSAAPGFVASITTHADTALFSAACPEQPGQNHVNCQWPAYWQELFNKYGFVCADSVRWNIWTDALIEPWYRQNMFLARRDPRNAGNEKRIQPVIHPDMIDLFCMARTRPPAPDRTPLWRRAARRLLRGDAKSHDRQSPIIL